MLRCPQLATMAIAATLIFTIATTAASANRLSISEQRIRLVWSELALEVSGLTIACPVTLEGSLERASIAKRAGTIGRISEAAANTCERGHLTVLRETLPWALNYVSFEGTLPTITDVKLNVIGMSLQFENIFTCLFAYESGEPFRGIATVSAGEISTFRADETARIGSAGGFFCSLSEKLHDAGTASVTIQGGSAHPRLSLIERTPPGLSPSPVEFGTVETSSTAERTITIEAGTEPTTVTNIRMRTGTSYSISDPNSCRGTRLAANGRCSFIVTFRAPEEIGRTVTDTVEAETSLANINDSVSGSTPQPPSASPSPVEFGRLATSTLSRREVTITSGVAATIESIGLRTGAHFAITDPNRCVGTRLAANGRCTFNVIVETPAERERTIEDTIVIGTSINTIEDVVRAST